MPDSDGRFSLARLELREVMIASFPGAVSEEDEQGLISVAQRTGLPVFFLANGATLTSVTEAEMNAQGWYSTFDPVDVAKWLQEGFTPLTGVWDWDASTYDRLRDAWIAATDHLLKRMGLKSEHKHEGEEGGAEDVQGDTISHEARIRRLEETVSVIQQELDRLSAEADATAAAEAAQDQHISDLTGQVADLKAQVAAAPKPDPATADIVTSIEATLQKLQAARQVAASTPATAPPGSTDASGASTNPVPPVVPTPADALASSAPPASGPTTSSPATVATPAPGPAQAGPIETSPTP